jgi:hypothetical protein
MPHVARRNRDSHEPGRATSPQHVERKVGLALTRRPFDGSHKINGPLQELFRPVGYASAGRADRAKFMLRKKST